MGSRLVACCFGVISKIRGWMNPQTYDSKKLAGMLLGFLVNVTIAEVVAYRILKRDVVGGELPEHVPELVIISVSCLEALAAPLVSWLGSQRRRQTLGLWMVGPLVCVGSWFALPDPNVRQESEFCDAANQNNDTLFTGMTRESTIRLAVVVFSGSVFALSRAAVWARGIALCDEYAPDMITVHYGTILSVRAVALILGHRIFTAHADSNFTVQVTILVGFLTLVMVQMFFVMPKGNDDPPGERKKGFLSSVGRICSNGLAMSQMVALGLIAAALWGYGYHENDIIKAKFLLDQATLETDNLVTMVQYIFVLSVLKSTASRFSAPVMKEYCRRVAIRHVVLMSVLVTALFAALALPSCDTGAVAGLGAEYYGHPECSFQCGCQPRWREFSPVCSTDDMTTYLSPCQAGCGAVETVNGINVYTNCTCGGGARVLAGGCAAGTCRFALDLHNTIFLILVTVSLLAFQAQGVLVVKSVRRGDRAVALGLTLAVVAALAFVAGPLLYHAIDVASCRWFEGDKCHLFNERYPKLVGFTSSFIALLATLLSIVTFVCVKKAERSEQNKQNTETNEDIELT